MKMIQIFPNVHKQTFSFKYTIPAVVHTMKHHGTAIASGRLEHESNFAQFVAEC